MNDMTLDPSLRPAGPLPLFPRPIWLLMAVYFCASLLHFSHNAEYIAFYPNMPQGLTRGGVYLAWLAVTGFGVVSVVFARIGWRAVAAVVLALYGALGVDGLAHYTLALCSEHTLATNLTIGFEVVAGLALCLSSAVLATRRFARGRRATAGASSSGARR